MSAEELKSLESRIAALEKANDPPKPFIPTPHQPIDPINRAEMPQSAMQDLVSAVPNSVVRDIVDGRRGISNSTSLIPTERSEPTQRKGNGWVSERPLTPPGIALIDRIAEAFDARDKAEKGR